MELKQQMLTVRFFLVHLSRYPVVKAVPQSQICLTGKTVLLNTTSLNMFAFPCVLINVLGPTWECKDV